LYFVFKTNDYSLTTNKKKEVNNFDVKEKKYF